MMTTRSSFAADHTDGTNRQREVVRAGDEPVSELQGDLPITGAHNQRSHLTLTVRRSGAMAGRFR